MAQLDLIVENHGSILLVRNRSAKGGQWLRDTAPEDAQWFGNALVVEPRYVGGVAEAAQNAGLTIA